MVTEDPAVPFDLAFFLSRLRRWLVLFLAVFLLVTGSIVAVALLLPTMYRAEALLVVESEQIPEGLAQSTVQTNADEQLQIIEKRVLSRDTLVNLASRLNLYQAEGREGGAPTSAGDIVEDLRNRITVGPSADRARNAGGNATDALLVSVMFSSPNPDMAAAVANELVTLILEEDAATRLQIARQTQAFFKQETTRLEKELSERSQVIQAYKEENIEALPDSLIFRREDLASIEERLSELNRDRRILVDQIDRIDRLIGGQAGSLGGEDTAAEGAEAPSTSGSLTTRDVRRSDLVSELSYLDEERDQLTARADALRATIAETPRVGIRLEALERDYENTRSQYDLAVDNLAKAEIGELIESLAKGRRITIIEQAVRPDRPHSPDRLRIALFGVVAGLAVAGGLILALEMLRGVIRRPEDITAVIGDSQMIVTLPHIRTRGDYARKWAVWSLSALILLFLAALLWQNRDNLQDLLPRLLGSARDLIPAAMAGVN